MSRPAKAIIDLAAIRHNYQLAQQLAPNAQTLAVVKANAYGHGSVAVAKTLEPLAPALAVACIEEALELRQAGIVKPILLLEGVFSADEVHIASAENFWLVINSSTQIEMIAAASVPQPLTVWLKADSGMHRLGLSGQPFRAAYLRLKSLPQVHDRVVIATHFAAADELESPYTQYQLDCFTAMVTGLGAPVSLANSAAIMAWPQAQGDYTRPGIMLYGSSPFNQPQINAERLKPVMTLESAVISVRTLDAGETVGYGRNWTAQRRSTIATVAIGYGDGYPRQTPNGTPVFINGQQAALAGHVSMDMITVDVTDLDSVEVGDQVELWGHHIALNEVAERVGTISYELVTRMPQRTPRVYIDTEKDAV